MRFLGAICSLLLLPLGGLALWFGVDGLWYALTEAPARDRPGDLFSAGIATAIGVVLVVFPLRWLWMAVHAGKRRPGRSGG